MVVDCWRSKEVNSFGDANSNLRHVPRRLAAWGKQKFGYMDKKINALQRKIQTMHKEGRHGLEMRPAKNNLDVL